MKTKKSEFSELFEELKVVIDTREKLPYKFSNFEIQKLNFGDYTIKFRNKLYLNEVVVERKSSVSELYSASGSERERFENELEKLSRVENAFVICEFSFLDIVKNQPDGIVSPQVVYGSIVKWHSYYGIPFIFCHNRANAYKYVWKFFYEYFKWNIYLEYSI